MHGSGVTLCLQVCKKCREGCLLGKCKAGSHQELNPGPVAWAACARTTGHPPALTILHKRYWMLQSLRTYCQNSIGVDQKILRKKTMLSVSLISLTLHVVEHLASAGKWREVVREMPGGCSSVFRALAAQARGTGFYVAAFQLCRTDLALGSVFFRAFRGGNFPP